MNKILFSAVISAILSVNADAADLLASVTNGKISDNSHGAKVLSLEEAKQVKGGYIIAYPRSGHGVGEFYAYLPETYDGKQLTLVAKKYGQTLNSGFSIYLSYDKKPILVDNGRGLEYGFKPIEKNRDTYMILSKYIDGAQNFLANNVFPQFNR